MGKGGGAGKVYFVLYLAVVLELLIIIVERDEAEELLLSKQRETMKIVQSILSQLQTGSGTEGINTRPQDEITIPPPGLNVKELGFDVKDSRKYIVEVGITDITSELPMRVGESTKDYTERLKKLIKLANVEEIEYQIFFSPSQDITSAPLFPSDDSIMKKGIDFKTWQSGQTITGPDGSIWEFKGLRKMTFDNDQTFSNIPIGDNYKNVKGEMIKPVYQPPLIVGPDFAPQISADSIFYYTDLSERKDITTSALEAAKKRAFTVNFKPPSIAGWYKLRFSSRTNRILGVRKTEGVQEVSEETTVNIGTVQLTVKDLRKVQKELTTKLEKFHLPNVEEFEKGGDLAKFEAALLHSEIEAAQSEEPTENVSHVRLFGYIAKLLAPGQSVNFKQNLGAIEFNVRVITPKAPPGADPAIVPPTDGYAASFDKLPAAFLFQISPYQGDGKNQVTAIVKETNQRFECKPLYLYNNTPNAPAMSGKADYIAYMNENLAVGKYTVEITHGISASSKQPKTETFDLEIFQTGLTDASQKDINAKLGFRALFGSSVDFAAVPSSGSKIPRSYEIKVSTDSKEQGNEATYDQLNIPQGKGLPLTSNASNVFVAIKWKQPYTNKEIMLFESSKEIKQRGPSILTATMVGPKYTFAPNLKTGSIEFTGIEASRPDADIGDVKANTVLTASLTGEAEIVGRIKGKEIKYSVSDVEVSDATEPNSSNTRWNIKINLQLISNIPSGAKSIPISGSFNINLRATATNPKNGKVGVGTKSLNVDVDYSITRK
ncbi:MAG: hypothetical protein HW421_1002 [Ignavibacteria bacterium]|nr:hypothetical protein [Ignavibacteria bacterium]